MPGGIVKNAIYIYRHIYMFARFVSVYIYIYIYIFVSCGLSDHIVHSDQLGSLTLVLQPVQKKEISEFIWIMHYQKIDSLSHRILGEGFG